MLGEDENVAEKEVVKLSAQRTQNQNYICYCKFTFRINSICSLMDAEIPAEWNGQQHQQNNCLPACRL